MTKDEALKLALEWAEARGEIVFAGGGMDAVNKMNSWVTAIKKALAQPEHKCNSHPKAPHGFNRNASHANDRYTCECESWDAYEAGYQAGVTAGIEMSTETEQKPVAWLNFNERGECREVFTPKMKETFPNYPTADMIPVYTIPPQRTWVGLTNDELTDLFYNTNLGQQSAVAQAIALLKERNT